MTKIAVSMGIIQPIKGEPAEKLLKELRDTVNTIKIDDLTKMLKENGIKFVGRK
jgi:hypothetical protein